MIIILFLVSILFFGSSLFSSKTFVYRDIHLLMYPMKIYAASCIKDGIFPFWNPYILCGSPFAAQVAHQTLYPFSIINYLFPIYTSLDLFIFLHVLLGGIFFFYLIKEEGLDKYSSLFASLSYAFSGIFLSFGNIFITIPTATWSPLLILFYLRALRRNSIFYAFITGGIIALEFLGGLPDFLFYDLVLLFFLSIAFLFSKKDVFPLKLLFTTGLFAMGIVLFQLLPFLEFILLSFRKIGIPFEKASFWSVSLKEFMGLFIPLFTAIPSEGYIFPYLGQKMITSLYLGIIPILCAIIGAFFIKKRVILFFLSILILSILISLGKNFFLYPFLYKHLPLFSMMRNPIKALHLLSLSLSILSAFGFSYISNKKTNIFLLPLFIFLLLSFIFPPFFFKGLLGPPEIIPSEVEIFKAFIHSNCLMVSIFLLISSSLFYLSKKYKIDIKKWLIFITIIDLWTFNGRLNYLIDEGFYKEKPEIVDLLLDNFTRYIPSPFTIREMAKKLSAKSQYSDFVLSKGLLNGNFGMNYCLFNAVGYEGVGLLDFYNLPVYNLTRMMGVKYLISKDKENIVVDELESLPRVFFVPNYKVLEHEDILNYIKSAKFNPEKEVILEEDPVFKKNRECKIQDAKSKVNIIRYEPNRVVVDVDVKTRGFLFLSDTYYPGWKAYINGKETKVYKANYCFRAIFINPGKKIVEFRYIPRTFYIGLVGSIASLILIAFFFFIKK